MSTIVDRFHGVVSGNSRLNQSIDTNTDATMRILFNKKKQEHFLRDIYIERKSFLNSLKMYTKEFRIKKRAEMVR